MAGFSIIIPTYNRAELLRTALKSVQELRIPDGRAAEIIVVDNNSTDHTADVAEEMARNGPIPLRRVVETQQGLNHGRNRGIQEACFEHLVYLDDDMQVNPGWLEGYVEAWETLHPDAVVGPVEPWFEEEPASWLTPRMIESVTSAYSRKGDRIMIVSADRAHELPGCNFGVLRHVAQEAGGFHPALDRSGAGMLAGGDWEFGQRLVRLGKRVVYSPQCRIRHFISKHKISREGLRARWEGSGATAGAMMRLQGQVIPFPRRLRLFIRMNRFFVRSWRYRVAGDETIAFHWELEALNLRGLLFKIPPNLKTRQ